MPYRDAMLVPPQDVTPPWWQRVWFRVARDDAAQLWPWARRAIGGRWSPSFDLSIFKLSWERVDGCPAARRHADHKQYAPMFGECSDEQCRCEVYSCRTELQR